MVLGEDMQAFRVDCLRFFAIALAIHLNAVSVMAAPHATLTCPDSECQAFPIFRIYPSVPHDQDGYDVGQDYIGCEIHETHFTLIPGRYPRCNVTHEDFDELMSEEDCSDYCDPFTPEIIVEDAVLPLKEMGVWK